jgi:hypothetical protein
MPVHKAAVKTVCRLSFTGARFGPAGHKPRWYRGNVADDARLRILFVDVRRANLAVGVALVVKAALRPGFFFLVLLTVTA